MGTENGLAQAQTIRTDFFQQRGGQFGQGMMNPGIGGTPVAGQGQPGAFGARGGVAGTVKSVDGNTLQLTAQDGSTLTVKIDSNTAIQKLTHAAISDIRASTRITVTGDTTSGTLTARTIQIGAGGQ
jgi:hypothetical protein